MPATALNNPGRLDPAVRKSMMGIVGAGIVMLLAAILGIFYMMYRDAPMTGAPAQLDQAEGVNARQAPVTPADAPSRAP
jgi:hypothetical protein